uniref:BACK domain-containing protein n=2 Tax=Ciona savignyi TaxID=51511 RepID=H2Z8A9_CIOSA
MRNVHCVLSAAGHMQLKPILNFCKTFLVGEISVYNCVDIIHIAEKYTLPGVEDKAYNFIAEHLNELVKTEELQKLTINNMSLLLDSYSLKNVSELELFEAARQWLLYKTERYQHVRTLMEKIHFPLIPPRDLLRYVNFVEFMRVECNYLLLEASNYHMLPHSQPHPSVC